VILVIAVLVAARLALDWRVRRGPPMFNQSQLRRQAVKTELDDMQKTITEITTKVNMSSQRLAANKPRATRLRLQADRGSGAGEAGPRPDTSRIFKVNYYLLGIWPSIA